MTFNQDPNSKAEMLSQIVKIGQKNLDLSFFELFL